MKNAHKSNPILHHIIKLNKRLFYIKFQPVKLIHVVMVKNRFQIFIFIFLPYELKNIFYNFPCEVTLTLPPSLLRGTRSKMGWNSLRIESRVPLSRKRSRVRIISHGKL